MMTTEHRTVFSLLDDVASHLRLVLALSFGAAVATAVIMLIMPVTYASSASFVPEIQSQQRLPASLAGLATQLGVNIGGEPSRSPPFYADLLRSREILERVLSARVQDPNGGTDTLRSRVTVAVDPRTNVVRLDVEARSPVAARDVARLLLQQLSAFNLDTRQNTARNRRQFVEGRVAATEQELRTAEDGLRTFYDRNRQWQNSPQLRFEEQRLTRQVAVQQELYLTLRREYETARIEEVNNTPVLTQIDEPEIPGRRIRPKRTLTVLVVTTIAGLLACGLAIAIERHRELIQSNEPEYRRLRDRLRRLTSERQPPAQMSVR